jgi:hypothetical protein
MVKYKPRKTSKVAVTTADAEEQARRDAEESVRFEIARLEEERLADLEKWAVWNTRPGPIPLGWSCLVDESSGSEYYWRDNDATGSVTWDRPAHGGEEASAEQMDAVVKQVRKTPRNPKEGEWQWALQKLWMRPAPDKVCNHQLPGSKDHHELITALTLLRYFLNGANKEYQDLFIATRHFEHEKLPTHLHKVLAVTQVLELLTSSDPSVCHGASCVLAAVCEGPNRGCQDAIANNHESIPRLLTLLGDDRTAQSAVLAIGRACERSHTANQDALVSADGAAMLLDMIEHEDDKVARAVQYTIFWASSGASTSTRTHWERSRGLCMSLVAPKPPVHLWEPAFCHRHHLERYVAISNEHCDSRKVVRKASNVAKQGEDYMSKGQKFAHDMDTQSDTSEAFGVKKGRARSKILHNALEHQPPNHAHMHLTTKHDKVFGHRHLHGDADYHYGDPEYSDIGHSRAASRKATKQFGSRPASSEMLRLQDDVDSSQLALPDMTRPSTSGSLQKSSSTLIVPQLGQLQESDRPSTSGSLPQGISAGNLRSGRSTYRSQGNLRSGRSSYRSQAQSEASDHDLHHIDPALDDQAVCRIGGEVRHVQQTGFLHPMGANKRFGICT